MLALATARSSDILIGLQVLSGNVSDKLVLVQQISRLTEQLQDADDSSLIFVADSGRYSAANMQFLSESGTVQLAAVEREARRRAWYIVATNVEELPAVKILRRYAEQHGVERGCAFLKDPLFLASSVFVQKHKRVMVIGFIMVCCLLPYRLAEYRIWEQLARRNETVANQLGKPTQRWLFQCRHSSRPLGRHHPRGGSQ